MVSVSKLFEDGKFEQIKDLIKMGYCNKGLENIVNKYARLYVEEEFAKLMCTNCEYCGKLQYTKDNMPGMLSGYHCIEMVNKM
jgi:hypothetical protein